MLALHVGEGDLDGLLHRRCVRHDVGEDGPARAGREDRILGAALAVLDADRVPEVVVDDTMARGLSGRPT